MPSLGFDPNDARALGSLRQLAEEAARAGGQAARLRFRTDLDVRLKADRSEVTDADEAAQAAVLACIRARRPADACIAEEALPGSPSGPSPTNDALCWVIDPIDGTRNFVRGIPLYVCSVAAMLDGLPLVGAIYDPQRELLYSASRRETLLVNGKPQPVGRGTQCQRLGPNPKPVVAIPSQPAGAVGPLAHAWLDRFVCRNLGSTALHLAMVATGELDAMLADNCRLWDLAAGCVLVTASGGKLTSPGGKPVFPLVVERYRGEELPVLATSALAQDRVLLP
jgi:myo-inositol-1(or 4)-monophosphatase